VPQAQIVEIEDVSFGYTPDRPVLRDINLAIPRGAVVGIMGQSGCGKTTLLRVLAGLTPPTAGAVDLDGRPVWSDGRADRAALSSVAMVFQEANLLPWASVEDNVALPLRLRGVGRAERRDRARALCALTGIEGFEARRPDELSIGMRARAALARALIVEPRVLLLDEPFAALDAITRDAMDEELQRVWMLRPTTAVLVTHSMAEAVLLADRVVSLSTRPARVVGVVDVPFPRPRSLDLEHTPAFQDLVRTLRDRLRAA
jgi:NitT/TauT family transport system ATP-binding protein